MEFTVIDKYRTGAEPIKYTTEELVERFCTDNTDGYPEEEINRLKKLVALLIESLPDRFNDIPSPYQFVNNHLLPFNTQLKP